MAEWTVVELEIYDAYPRKVARPKALEAIRRALKKVEASKLLAAVKAYAASRVGEPPQFTPHPSTWFNQERWADPITVPELPANHPNKGVYGADRANDYDIIKVNGRWVNRQAI